jgi:MFS family permease
MPTATGTPRRLMPAGMRQSAWQALDNPDFKLYFAGSLVSNLGTWMQNTAQVLLAYQLTDSVFAVGLVACAQFSGSLVLGPWAAVAASRVGGKRILVAAQVASAAIAGYLAILQAVGSLKEGALIAGALGLGLVFTFALPIQTALVPRLVPDRPPDTQAAMAMNSVSYNIGRAVAPVISVVVIATNGFAWAFAANAISFLFFAVVLAKVRRRRATRKHEAVRAGDGVRVAFKQPRVILLLAMVAAVTFADDPVLIQGPALARHVHVPSYVAGYFLAMLGLGTVLGSLGPIRRPEDWTTSKASRRAAFSLVFLFASIVVFAAGIDIRISLLAAFAAGVAVLYAGTLAQAQLTRHRPDHMAGVMALWGIAWAGAKPVASLLDGWLSSHLHLWVAAAILASPALVLALFEILLSKKAKKRIKKFGTQRMSHWVRSPSPLASMPSGSGQGGR